MQVLVVSAKIRFNVVGRSMARCCAYAIKGVDLSESVTIDSCDGQVRD